MKLKCLIVDDEPLAIRLIENHISKIDYLEVSATVGNALKAFEALNTQTFDLMFLDIKMPTITGIDFLKTLKNPPTTIITTAYRDFALEGFELEVMDYLLKPITFERFFKSVDRLHRANNQKLAMEFGHSKGEDLIIKSGAKNHRVNTSEILFIESLKDYVKIHIPDGRHIISKNKISDINDRLSANGFLRVHRSYIINTAKISAFTSTHLEVNETKIPIGTSYKEAVDEYLKNLKSYL